MILSLLGSSALWVPEGFLPRETSLFSLPWISIHEVPQKDFLLQDKSDLLLFSWTL